MQFVSSRMFVIFPFLACSRAEVLLRASNTVGKAGAGIRLIDGTGSSSSVGLLQIPTASAFGTVCGMNLGAADVVCRSLGFDHGSVGSACGNYGGSNLCGASGTPVAAKNLQCEGGELDIQECSWAPPDDECLSHASDAIVYCASAGGVSLQDGAVRLVATDGSPSINGQGRLEMFRAGSWSPVCGSGFTAGAEAVACKTMGFAGASPLAVRPDCGSSGGCGTTPPRISELACSGQEADILSCPFEEGDDVFCAAEESVIVSCAGDGDTQGRPMKMPMTQATLASRTMK